MIKVDFYDSIDDGLLKFAVIVSKYEGKWVLCKHKQRSTYEFPGGHREIGEEILATAKRELYEETGATEFSIQQIGVYSVSTDQEAGGKDQTFGMLYFAEIFKLDVLPGFEMEKIELFDIPPNNWTYPDIQPKLFERFYRMISNL
jgi:8-oxo-dGTP diphosphatase